MSEALYFYGVNGTGGGYVVPPIEPEPEPRPDPGRHNGRRLRTFDPNDPRFAPTPRRPRRRRGLIHTADANDLASSGWAVVFGHDTHPAVIEALKPLIDLRREQAARHREQRFKLCTGTQGHRENESAQDFLAHHKYSFGLADPDRFPYHVLLVGSPRSIPFAFQYELDVQYSVGRVYFDKPEDYAAYAESVVAAEGRLREHARLPVAFFATEHTGDKATQTSAQHLVQELAHGLATSGLACDVRCERGAAATKDTALRLLGGELKPALLFTATHGVAFERDDPCHLSRQGALLCQDSPGPALMTRRDRIPAKDYVWAEDVGAQADVSGMIAFFFGCYTAGTPAGDTTAGLVSEPLRAREEFVARLPQRLLTHPRGGALAVIGHVDQAWNATFWTQRTGPNVSTFKDTLGRIINGERLGWALEAFGQHLGQASAAMDGEHMRGATPGQIAALREMSTRNYVLLGDPAVRLPPPAPPPPPPPERRRRPRGWDPNTPA